VERLNRDDADESLKPLPTGFDDLDKLLKGLDGYGILAGRPSMGKSTLAMNMIVHLARWKSKRAAWYSLEDARTNVVARVLSKLTGQAANKLRDGEVAEWKPFMEAVDQVISGWGGRVWLNDAPRLTAMEIRADAARRQATDGLDLIVVDYLQLAKTGDDRRDFNDRARVSEVSAVLKATGRDLGVPVVALSQLSRKCEDRNDKRPVLSDLRESGTLEQDADWVAFVYRDEYYHDNTERPNIADIIVAKNKNGATGSVALFYKKESMTFLNAEIRARDVEGSYL
jgi:replicative DNA helicase